MAATIDWSLRLLDGEEALLFSRLGAFVGDASLPMIEAVCGDERLPDPVDVLTQLLDKSLVRSRTGDDGAPRFGMLELLRARAAELLATDDDRDAIARRHADVIADRVEEIDRERWGTLMSTWPDLLSHLLPEFRRAHDWSVEQGEWELAGRLAAAFGAFWHREGGLAEGHRRLDVVLDHDEELSRHTLARLLAATSIVTWDSGDVVGARETWRRAADQLEALGDLPLLAYVLAGMAVTTIDDPDLHDWARSLLERAVALARGSDRPASLAEVLNMRGEFARGTGDDALARESYSETLRVAIEIGDVSMERVGLANLAYVECHEGNFDEARRIGRIALRACHGAGRRLMSAWSLGELAIPACGLGEYELAAQLMGAAQRAVAALGGGRYPADVVEDERLIAELVDVMGQEAYDHHVAEGAALTLDEAVTIALDDRPAATGR